MVESSWESCCAAAEFKRQDRVGSRSHGWQLLTQATVLYSSIL